MMGRVLIASIMEEYNKNAWEEIVGRCEEVGVDGFEINFSCPHGMPERRMGTRSSGIVIVDSGLPQMLLGCTSPVVATSCSSETPT
jgi:dihydroorotate dehydrogenase